MNRVWKLSEEGRKLTWNEWKHAGGCSLSNLGEGMAARNLGLPPAAWERGEITLGRIEDAWAAAGRELAGFAVRHLNRPEWAVPYEEEAHVKNA